jgi:GDP-L-fucose synthase
MQISMNKKKILVAGGAGLLGVNLTRRLSHLNAMVESSYFHRPPPQDLIQHYQQYDFNDYQNCLRATRDKNVVVICAVQATGVQGMLQSPTAAILPNLSIHAGLFESCRQNEVDQVIWVSSSTVYQEAYYPIREDQLDLNQSPYLLYQGVGWVYRYLEELANCYIDQEDMQIGVIRTSNIYGPYDRFDDHKSHVIPALIKRALRKEDPFIVWGHGSTVRDFIFVEDLVTAILKVMQIGCSDRPINFSCGQPVQIEEAVNLILNACEHPVAPVYDASKPKAIPYRVLDNTRFETLYGTFAKTSLEEGIQKTIDWYCSEASRE